MDTTIPVSLRVTLLRTNRAEISIVAVYGLFCLLAGLILAKLPVPHLWVIALPLALLGLGWQITFILMPVNRDLDAVARSAVAGVLSLGVGGGCALFLARTNQGLHVETLLALLVSLSGLFTVLGLLRQPDGWAPGQFLLPPIAWVRLNLPSPALTPWLTPSQEAARSSPLRARLC